MVKFASDFVAPEKILKIKVEIEVYLDDGEKYLASLSVIRGQRISDLMNDDRQFLPIELSGGNVIILRKAVISRVVQLDQHIERDKISDP